MRTVAALFTATVLAGLLVACDGGPTQPRIDPPPAPSPGGANPVATRLEIGGPREVPPDGTAQFTATAHFSDGSSRQVTGETNWTSSNVSVLSISPTGLATARRAGEASLSARFTAPNTGLSSTREVIVVPSGTYRLSGLVTEADVPAGPVPDARVEARSALGEFLTTTTAGNGRYTLYGVASGDVQIHVAKDGYEPYVRIVTVNEHQTLNVELALRAPRPQLAGTYTLTITAAESCRDELPEEARSRTYTADLRQEGSQLRASLAGAAFLASGGSAFGGRVEPGQVVFSLSAPDLYYGYYLPDLAEQLSASRYLVVSGAVRATIEVARITGTLNGDFQIFDRDLRSCWPCPRPVVQCRSAAHHFVLSR